MQTLIAAIAAFRQQHGLSKSSFGLLALNDKALVSQIENGRRVWPETEQKIRSFMAEYKPPTADAPAAEEAA
jgi:hypothetical protein